MSEAIFERYKDAIRTGHLAVLRGQLDQAAAAYREAIELAPDRAVPRTALAGILLRAGDPGAALAACDDALLRAADDDGATQGRAQALSSLGRPAEAAAAYERLAEIRRGGERLGDACEALRRALEIEPTPARRMRYHDLARELRLSAGVAQAARALGRELRLLEEGTGWSDGPVGTPSAVPPTAEPPEAAPADVALPLAAPRPDGEALIREAEAAEERGDIAAAAAGAMAAARAYHAAGHSLAALDTCLWAIELAPGDVDLHLLLAGVQVERGWVTAAADTYRHLARLADLAGDAGTIERIRAAVGAAFPADVRPAPGG